MQNIKNTYALQPHSLIALFSFFNYIFVSFCASFCQHKSTNQQRAQLKWSKSNSAAILTKRATPDLLLITKWSVVIQIKLAFEHVQCALHHLLSRARAHTCTRTACRSFWNCPRQGKQQSIKQKSIGDCFQHDKHHAVRSRKFKWKTTCVNAFFCLCWAVETRAIWLMWDKKVCFYTVQYYTLYDSRRKMYFVFSFAWRCAHYTPHAGIRSMLCAFLNRI